MSEGKPESKIQSESKIQTAILKHLTSRGVFAWRQNNLAVYDPKLGHYRSHTGLLGVPDIIAIIKGQFVGFEVKARYGKQSADQMLFERRCKRAGGAYFVVRSIEDVDIALEAIKTTT